MNNDPNNPTDPNNNPQVPNPSAPNFQAPTQPNLGQPAPFQPNPAQFDAQGSVQQVGFSGQPQQPTLPQQPQQVQPIAAMSAPKAKSQKGLFIIIAIAAIVLIGGGVTAAILMNSNKDKVSDDSKSSSSTTDKSIDKNTDKTGDDSSSEAPASGSDVAIGNSNSSSSGNAGYGTPQGVADSLARDSSVKSAKVSTVAGDSKNLKVELDMAKYPLGGVELRNVVIKALNMMGGSNKYSKLTMVFASDNAKVADAVSNDVGGFLKDSVVGSPTASTAVFDTSKLMN